MTKKRNMQIEGLRGVAMLFVVCYHYFAGFPKHFFQPLQHNWFGIGLWGYFGVGIFILISGYFMLGAEKQNPILFTLRKVIRLWPVYAVAITVCFLLTRIVPLPERTVSLGAYLLNLPFINGFIGVDYVDGAHWYLTTLIACAFISALISHIDKKKQWIALALWTFLILVFQNAEIDNRALNLLFDGLYKVFGGRYAPMFITGVAVKRFTEDKGRGNLFAIITANLVNLLVFGWMRGIAFLIALSLFCLANARKLPLLSTKALVWMGMVSYSVYVIHQNNGFWCMYLVSESIGKYTPIISVICTIAAVGVGAVFYYCIEKPCNQLIKKKIR